MSTNLENEILDNKEISIILESLKKPSQDITSALDEPHRCPSRDQFNAKLNNFFVIKKDPLLTAVCGEIGNNAFDHNPGGWDQLPGLYFNWEINGVIIFVDRGQGILNSLKKVRSALKTDEEALKTAFLERVSGRDPEKRGNGLKFVAKSIENNPWSLYFRSGNGVVLIEGQSKKFYANDEYIQGCLAVIKY
jgi:hypothetical protein